MEVKKIKTSKDHENIDYIKYEIKSTKLLFVFLCKLSIDGIPAKKLNFIFDSIRYKKTNTKFVYVTKALSRDGGYKIQAFPDPFTEYKLGSMEKETENAVMSSLIIK